MKLFQIDAFTQEVFKGNPAAVCILESERSDKWLQQFAIEMNLSETAYILKKGDRYVLRWFTPAKEVPLCGHATLASAFTLFSEGYHDPSTPIHFDTLSGELIVQYEKNGSLKMDFPANRADTITFDDLDRVEREFQGELKDVLTYPDELIFIFEDVQTVLNARPDMGWISGLAANGVVISGWSGSEKFDFASRYFAPNLGIPEDPVTGFMHTILTPYWSDQKGLTVFRAFQASERTGQMDTELIGDRVILKGSAVKVFKTDIDF